MCNMKVAKLTLTQKNKLVGQEYATDSYFNPTLDADGNWFISVEEVNQCTNADFNWVKDLPLIEFKPIVTELR